MARVNEGALNFSDVNVTEYQIVDMLRVLYQQVNTSREMVNKKIGDITYLTNPYRTTAVLPTASGADLDEEYRGTGTGIRLVQNLSAKSDLKKIMIFISKLDKLATKKALIINFMRLGMHIILPEEFHLVEDLRQLYDPAISQLNEDFIQQINDTNVTLNNAIKEFTEYSAKDIEEAENLLMDFIATNMGDEAVQLAKDYGYYMKSGGHTNLMKAFAPYMKNSEEIKQKFSETLSIYRNVITTYRSPSIGELLSHFNISNTTYRNNRADGLNLLVKTMPKNFLSRII